MKLCEQLNSGLVQGRAVRTVIYRQIALIAGLVVLCLFHCETARAQFGGLQVQVGGYGNGLRVGGFGYGNGFNNGYGNGYGYGNTYRNSYGVGNGYGYGNGYGNGYQSGYGSYIQPSSVYLGGAANNGYGYRNYPTVNYGYGATRYYNSSMRRYGPRRFR